MGRGEEEGAAAEKPFSTMAPTRWGGGAAAEAAAVAAPERGGAGSKGSSTTLRRVGCAPGWCFRFVPSSIGSMVGGALLVIGGEGLRGGGNEGLVWILA